MKDQGEGLDQDRMRREDLGAVDQVQDHAHHHLDHDMKRNVIITGDDTPHLSLTREGDIAERRVTDAETIPLIPLISCLMRIAE